MKCRQDVNFMTTTGATSGELESRTENHKLSGCSCVVTGALQWRHNESDGVSNHQAHDILLNRLFRRRSKKTWKLYVTGLCEGNLPVTGEFPAHRPVTRNFGVFFDLRLNKRLSKQSRRWWFEHKWQGPVTRKMFPFDDVIMGAGVVVMVSSQPQVTTKLASWQYSQDVHLEFKWLKTSWYCCI